MTSDHLIKRHQQRPGFRLADVAEVGLPIYTLKVDAVTMAHKRVAPIEEFLLRSVAIGLSNLAEISAFLGINEEVIKPALVNLAQTENIALAAKSGQQVWTLTTKGKTTLGTAEVVSPEESTFPIHFDAILRKPTYFRFQKLLKHSELAEAGLIEIESYPPKRPDMSEVSAVDLERILKNFNVSTEQRRDILAIRDLDQKSIKKHFVSATALLFRALEGSEAQLAFVIDGKLSIEHEIAYARSQGLERTLQSIAQKDFIEAQEIEEIASMVSPPLKAQQQEVEEAVRAAEANVAEAVQQFEKARDEERDDLRQKLDEVQKKLTQLQADEQQFEIKNLYVLDHPPLLQDALLNAQERVLLISPWIRAEVVTRDFLAKLEELLRRKVAVYIGYGFQADETQDSRQADKAAVHKLSELASRYKTFKFSRLGSTHAKVLIKDSEFAAITSFNWLSFKGDPNRQFRDEQGTLVRKGSLVDKKFDELVLRFQ